MLGGTIGYGADLESLTRSTKINLKLEPFFCVSHQRLLDGLVAGGFFLIREHPADKLNSELNEFIWKHLDPSVESADEARASIDPAQRGSLEDLLSRARCLAEFGDPIGLIRGVQRASVLRRGESPLPHLAEVSFHDPQSFQQRIESYLNEPALRRSMAEAQRQAVESHRSYAAGMRHVMRSIGHLIAAENAAPATGAQERAA